MADDKWAPNAPLTCCRQSANLDIVLKKDAKGVTVYQCRKCQRRHYRMVVEPGDLRPSAPNERATFQPGRFRVN